MILGKRADAKRAEADFLDLLKEHGDLTPESDWKQVGRQGDHVLSDQLMGSCTFARPDPRPRR
jgi:hypothetical protein